MQLQHKTMKLLPIDINETKNVPFQENRECVAVLEVYPDYYKRVGYHPPWIGYFVVNDKDEIVGCGGYKGQPKDDTVEIAYGIFEKFEGQGVGTQICRQLVLLSLQTNPVLKIMARTLPENHASIAIVKRNGFECIGLVYDEDDGDVLEWEFKKH